MMQSARVVAMALAVVVAACGQKGPPLAPLHLVPAAPPNVVVKRVGDEARIQFDVPSTNVNGPGTLALDRVEVYAATVAPGAARPANRELLIAKHRVATIAIKPPPVEGEAPPETPETKEPDTRPAAGERTAFVEPLSEQVLVPVFTKKPTTAAAEAVTRAAAASAVAIAAAAIGPAAQATAAAMAPASAAPTHAVRLYVVRGVTKSGRPGPPSTRVELPLVASPPPPPAPVAATTESAIVLTWIGPVSLDPIAFNVYKAGGSDPINAAPVAEARYERAGVQFGTEECFVLRSVQKIGAIFLESASSPSTCITPRDTFAPAAPRGLSAVAGEGLMNLSWDANKETDLAGYLVLRGEAPGDTLQPLTPAPIAGTSYEDKTVAAGVRYVYVVVAVDKASPSNRSAQSARVEETAR
jgi:predicted small lipoprotein YifL